MPTANKTSGAKAGTTARKTAATRRAASSARKAGTVRARTARANGASTRVAQRTRQPVSDRPVAAFGDYAERAVLIQVGAALTARDRVISSVNNTFSSYSSPTKAQAQLRRFERRGATARNRLEREVRKARVRVERQLRQRRRRIGKTVSEFEERRDAVAKNGTDLASRVPELASRVQERVLSLV